VGPAAFEAKAEPTFISQILALKLSMEDAAPSPTQVNLLNTFRDEILGNTICTYALNNHKASFGHSKFSLVAADWKLTLELRLGLVSSQHDKLEALVDKQAIESSQAITLTT
jgi:hypothetical protein